MFTSDRDYIINIAVELPHPGSRKLIMKGAVGAVQHQHAASTLHSEQTMIWSTGLDVVQIVGHSGSSNHPLTRSVNSACWDRRP
jgi:hypothetical protein